MKTFLEPQFGVALVYEFQTKRILTETYFRSQFKVS